MKEHQEGSRTARAAAVGSTVYRVKVLHSNAIEYCVAEQPVHRGDHVIVPTRYGKALGVTLGTVGGLTEVATQEIVRIERRADVEDLEKEARNRKKEERAFALCQEKIAQRNLEMKLVAAHQLLFEPKMVFFFTAEERVDFRDLVKDLVQTLRTRVELRQIGVRDESRLVGGLGVCGRAFCCHKLTDRMSPVSIKMAKKQDLSLNSTKISGPCGRLLCCLSYEYPFYTDERNRAPAVGTRIACDGEACRVSEVNILSRRVRLTAESGRVLVLPLDALRFNASDKRWTAAAQESGGASANSSSRLPTT
jgi:cell fate regulator YaaT (PSP1 superfamily)